MHAENERIKPFSKQIDIRYQWLREVVTSKIIRLGYTPPAEQVADILTKPTSTGVLLEPRAVLLGGEKLSSVGDGQLKNKLLGDCPEQNRIPFGILPLGSSVRGLKSSRSDRENPVWDRESRLG